MTDHKKSKGEKLFILQIMIPIAVVAAVFVVSYLYLSNVFKPAPKMEVFADNTYAETLHVVTDMNYAPFSYIDENGEYAGLDVELMNEIANRLNMNLDLVLMDWNDANAAIQSGEADIIMNMETDLVTPESGMIATIPTTEKQYVVYGRKAISSVIDLYGTRIASLHRLPTLELDITYIDSYQAIFEALQAGEFDYAICPIQIGNAFLERLDLTNVYPSYAVGHVYGALALPADRTQLCDRINPILKSLQDEGFLDSLDGKWVNHRYEYTSITAVIGGHPGFALVLLGGLLMLVVFAFLYIMAQRRGAAEKAAYTRQLQDNLEVIRAARVKAYLDELTGVRNKNAFKELTDTIQIEVDHGTAEPFAIVVCDVNGLKQINDVQGHRAGDRFIREACQIICHIYDHSPVFRIGGDEFTVVLRGHDFEHRRELIQKLERTAHDNQKTGGIVIAAGMSDYKGDKKVTAVFERADKAMYRNKTALKSEER